MTLPVAARPLLAAALLLAFAHQAPAQSAEAETLVPVAAEAPGLPLADAAWKFATAWGDGAEAAGAAGLRWVLGKPGLGLRYGVAPADGRRHIRLFATAPSAEGSFTTLSTKSPALPETLRLNF